MKLTIEIDTNECGNDALIYVSKLLQLPNNEKIATEDLPDNGIDKPVKEKKPRKKSDDISLVTNEQVATEEPIPLAVAPVPIPPPLPPVMPPVVPPPPMTHPVQSEFLKLMKYVAQLMTEGKLTQEKVEEFTRVINCTVEGKGMIGKLKELPHLIPLFLNLVEDHVSNKT